VSCVHTGVSTINIKTEADSNDIIVSSQHVKPSTGCLSFSCCILSVFISHIYIVSCCVLIVLMRHVYDVNIADGQRNKTECFSQIHVTQQTELASCLIYAQP